MEKDFNIAILQMQKQPPFQLDGKKILSAFETILNSSNSKDIIKQADNYIHECQSNTQFALVLMHIFNQVVNPQQKLQILIHLKNLIKRNWTTKRRVNEISLSQQIKNNIKNGLIQLYQANWQHFYKEFNQIFKFLAKYQFPFTYPSLKKFIYQILNTLASSDIEAMIAPNQLLPYLSLIKTVFKEYSSKKFTHSQSSFVEHIAEAIKLSYIIFQKINNVLKLIKSSEVNPEIGNKLFECSRKIDKIILYCIQSSVTALQMDPNLIEIVFSLVNKIDLILQLKSKEFNDQVQRNILAIVEGTSRLQISFPFMFTSFLQKYCKTTLSLLINENFTYEKLLHFIIMANTKPLTIFAYYTNEAQFRQSIQSRKGTGQTYLQQQMICHATFCNVYGGSNATAFLEKIIMDLMSKYRREENEDDMLFQDTENVQTCSSNQYVSFDLLLILIKNLVGRFKQQFKPFILKIFDHLIQNRLTSQNTHVANHMYEVILLLPKVYDQVNLNMDKIFNLMQICFELDDFVMFSRIIRGYNNYFDSGTLGKIFQILIQIVAKPHVSHRIMYRCVLCIKKILAQHEQEGLPIEKLGLCLLNLLKLVEIYRGVPTNVWNLLQLIDSLLKIWNIQALLMNLQSIIESLKILVQKKDNQQFILNAISDLLQNILQVVTPDVVTNNYLLEYLYETSINLIGMNVCNRNVLNPQVLYKLWLSVARSASINNCSSAFADTFLNALFKMKESIMQEDSVIFLQLAEEYLLGGFLNLTVQNLLSISDQVLKNLGGQENHGVIMALFSLYFTFYLKTKTVIPKMIVYGIQQIRELQNRLNQPINILRTFLVLVINHHIIDLGLEKIFQILSQAYNNYQTWFLPYIWSLQYLNHKYSCKIASISMLLSLQALRNSGILFTEIEDCVPFFKILKSISFQIEPLNLLNVYSSYINSFKMMHSDQKIIRTRTSVSEIKNYPRKYRSHINTDWATCNLTEMLYQKVWAILNSLGWQINVLDEKMDKIGSTKIIAILTKKNQENN